MRWLLVQVRLGVVTFIAFFRLDENHPMAAPVGVTETTHEPKCYEHPSNPKVKFWDLPGFGTQAYSDLSTYCKEVGMEKYQAFLIFTDTRFTDVDVKLAKEVGNMKKKFFFVRAKIDQDVRNEQRKHTFNEEVMLKQIRANCFENLGSSLNKEENVFLISNHYTEKWEFARLNQAILDAMPEYEQESLTLSLGNRSTDMLKRKVKILKRRVKTVAALSGVVGVAPVPGLSFAVDMALIMHELKFYKSQLGIPKEGSSKFSKLSSDTQTKVKAIVILLANVTSYFVKFAAVEAAEQVSLFLPLVGWLIAGVISWLTTYHFLNKKLKEMEEVAFFVLKEAVHTC